MREAARPVFLQQLGPESLPVPDPDPEKAAADPGQQECAYNPGRFCVRVEGAPGEPGRGRKQTRAKDIKLARCVSAGFPAEQAGGIGPA